jgi:hypothetical protein
VEEHLLNAEEKVMDVSCADDAWLSTDHFLASAHRKRLGPRGHDILRFRGRPNINYIQSTE